jgi:hypothetical protein
MGFLRHRGDEPVGERFQMREKLLSIGDDYWIENDQGERAYNDAWEPDVAGGDRREAERGEVSNDSRHEQMDGSICSEGIRVLITACVGTHGRGEFHHAGPLA